VDLLAGMTTFVRIVDAQSLSGAARSLELSLPAVSRQLQALERELGAALLVRSTRRLRVTDAGRAFYERSVRILRDVEAAKGALGEGDAASGTLVVSVGVTIGMHFVVPRVNGLLRAHPALQIELRLEERLADLIGEGVDVAIRAGARLPETTAHVAASIARFRRVVVAAPSYVRCRGAPREPEQLAGHDVIVQTGANGAMSRWELERGEEARVVDVRGRVRASTPAAIRDLAISGTGVAFVPTWLVQGDIEAGRLRRLLAKWEGREVVAWAFYRAELRGSRRIAALLAALR
jgi:DNA-binding transcriptional LysR family regulator